MPVFCFTSTDCCEMIVLPGRHVVTSQKHKISLMLCSNTSCTPFLSVYFKSGVINSRSTRIRTRTCVFVCSAVSRRQMRRSSQDLNWNGKRTLDLFALIGVELVRLIIPILISDCLHLLWCTFGRAKGLFRMISSLSN